MLICQGIREIGMDVNQKVYNTRATFLESVAVLEEEVEVSSNLNTRPI